MPSSFSDIDVASGKFRITAGGEMTLDVASVALSPGGKAALKNALALAIADITGLNSTLEGKADVTAVGSALAGKADAAATTTALAGKAPLAAPDFTEGIRIAQGTSRLAIAVSTPTYPDGFFSVDDGIIGLGDLAGDVHATYLQINDANSTITLSGNANAIGTLTVLSTLYPDGIFRAHDGVVDIGDASGDRNNTYIQVNDESGTISLIAGVNHVILQDAGTTFSGDVVVQGALTGPTITALSNAIANASGGTVHQVVDEAARLRLNPNNVRDLDAVNVGGGYQILRFGIPDNSAISGGERILFTPVGLVDPAFEYCVTINGEQPTPSGDWSCYAIPVTRAYDSSDQDGNPITIGSNSDIAQDFYGALSTGPGAITGPNASGEFGEGYVKLKLSSDYILSDPSGWVSITPVSTGADRDNFYLVKNKAMLGADSDSENEKAFTRIKFFDPSKPGPIGSITPDQGYFSHVNTTSGVSIQGGGLSVNGGATFLLNTTLNGTLNVSGTTSVGLLYVSNLSAVCSSLLPATSTVNIGSIGSNSWAGIYARSFGLCRTNETYCVKVSSSASVTQNRTLNLSVLDADRAVTIFGNTTLPVFSQQATFTGLTAARSYALPDGAYTLAALEKAQTWTQAQTFSSTITALVVALADGAYLATDSNKLTVSPASGKDISIAVVPGRIINLDISGGYGCIVAQNILYPYVNGTVSLGGVSNRWATVYTVNLNATGNLTVSTAGKGLQLKSGTDQRTGNATLSAGTVTVANTTITANTIIQLTRKTAGGTVGDLTYTLTAGTSFTINSANIADASVVSYLLIELN